MMLKPDRDKAEDERDGEKWKHWQDVARGHGSSLPPRVEQKNQGEHHHRTFAQHGGDEPTETREVVCALAMQVEVEVSGRCQEQERKRKCVLQFGDPSDRFHCYRVDGKN